MDDAAFEALLAPCEPALRRFLYCRLPCKADGDDVWQETLLAAYRHRDGVRDGTRFKAWLLQIAANKCRDFYRERARRRELSLEDVPLAGLTQSRGGLTAVRAVRDTLAALPEDDAALLRLFYLRELPQAEIARRLGIPVGTVKSRLHKARQRFGAAYPFPPAKGAVIMNTLPEQLPAYTIEPSPLPPFPLRWEELMGWFIVPRPGETRAWAMYDAPGGRRTEAYTMAVTGRARVHGVEGVEITATEHRGGEHESLPVSRSLTRTFVAQLTDTHCRILAESHVEEGVRLCHTFLDGDDFLPNWGFGEDNCGNEVALCPKGLIRREGDAVIAAPQPFLLDVTGRYRVTLGGKGYDCVCVTDVETYQSGIMTEQFLDANGRTVLWRRFNRDDWHLERYGGRRWSARLPDNQRLTVNGDLYVHWYDCITDYVL